MKGFVAVLEREISERRLLALVAFILGLVPLALPLVPGLLPGGFSAEDLRSGLAIGLTALLTVILALFLGGTIITGDLAERRLGFYFARPLSGGAIWAGKLGAALALTLATAFLVALPTLAIDGLRPWGLLANDLPQPRPAFPNRAFTATWFFLAWIALVLLAVLAAHAASVMIRARSALLALPGSGSTPRPSWWPCWPSPWQGSSRWSGAGRICAAGTGSSRCLSGGR